MTARMRAPDRRRQLLAAALPCFARKGYRGTTTAELAAAAGVTPPILYRHFESKQDLFDVLLGEAVGRVVNAWQAQLEGVAEPARRRRALAEAVGRVGAAADRRLIVRALSEAEGDGAVARPARRCLGRLRRFVAQEIEVLQSAGVARADDPPRLLARRVVSAAVGEAITSRPGAAGPRRDSARWLESLLAPPDRTPAGTAGRRGSPTSER
jgi:AcrR family transcriptional regulator